MRPEPPGFLGPFPGVLVRTDAPALGFQQGTFTCSGTPRPRVQKGLFQCFLFLFWGGVGLLFIGSTFPQRLRTAGPHQELKALSLVPSGTFQIVCSSLAHTLKAVSC